MKVFLFLIFCMFFLMVKSQGCNGQPSRFLCEQISVCEWVTPSIGREYCRRKSFEFLE